MTETTLTQNPSDSAQQLQQPSLSIDAVLQELQHWRDNREVHKETSIPEALWKKIFSLSQAHPPAKIRGLFGISSQQYQHKFNQYFPTQTSLLPASPLTTIPFGSARPKSAPGRRRCINL